MEWVRWRKWLVRIARIVAIVYIVLIVVFYALQKYFIYPGTSTQGTADAQVRPGPGVELLKLKSADGTQIAALFGKAVGADDPAHCPTVLFFYGNGQCIAYATDIFDRLRKIGVNVIIPDYPGYGMSGGKISEAGCYAAADAVHDYLLTRGDIDPDRFVSVGWSLGSGIAVDLASRRKVCGVMIFSPFTSMAEMARKVTPFLPTSLMLTEHFDNLKKIDRIKCPILLVHGAVDDLIPPGMSERLRAAVADHAKRIVVPDAGHNDLFDIGGKKLWQEIDEFVKSLP